MTELQLAKGVQDIPPEEKILMNEVVQTIAETFELYGFAPLETPLLERYETLASKFAAGEASDALKETFKLKDQGGRDLGLRFDLTVPLARFIAMNPTLKMPFKRYEMGPVFRDGPIKAGRVRQFWQCDADVVGSSSLVAEAELLSIFATVFEKLNLPIIIKTNNRKILNGILEQAGITEKEKKEKAIIVIDKLDKIGKEGVSKELSERGCEQKQISKLFSLVKEGITLEELKQKLTAESGKQGITELEEVFSYLKILSVKNVKFDISLARGLAYYTGAVFEVFLQKGMQKGSGSITSSLGSGGRWDNMIGQFMGGNREVPAVGISFGLVPIGEALKEKRKMEKKTLTKILIIPINTLKESLLAAQELRNKKIPTEVAVLKGVSKNLDYANALGIPFAVILGEDELKRKKVLLKDMKEGTEQLLALNGVVKKLGKK